MSAKTRRRDSDTNLQRKARATLAKAEREERDVRKTGTARRKPLRSRAYKRMRKRSSWGPAAMVWLTVGLGELLGAGLMLGGKGVGLVAASGAERVRGKVSTRKWVKALSDGTVLTPEQAARVMKASGWGKTRLVCACGEVHHSFESLNRHFLSTHANEEPAAVTRPLPKIVRGATAASAGKVIVLPVGTAVGGRHRPNRVRGVSSATAQAAVVKYQPHITEIGKRALTVDNNSARIATAFKQYGDQPPPVYLTDMRATLAGFERAMMIAAESVDAYRLMLKRRKNVDGIVVDGPTKEMMDLLTAAGRQATIMIANFEVTYGVQIKVASEGVTVPDPKFFEKSG